MDDKVKDLTAYENRFKEDPTSFNDFQAMDFVKELKNQNKNDEAIEVGRTFRQVAPELKRYINHYGFALYNRFINIDDEAIQDNEKLFFDILDEIAEVCKQERYSPLEPAVNRAVKYLTHQDPVDYNKVNDMLNKLDAPTLNDKPFVNADGVEFESFKEKWYRLKIRALFETKRYRECIEEANIALTLPLKWHHNTLNWIKYYRGSSLVEVGRYEEAEQVFLSLKNFRAAHSADVLFKLYLHTDRKDEAYTNLIYDFFRDGFDRRNLGIYKNTLAMAEDKGIEKASQLAAALVKALDPETEVTEDISAYADLDASALFDKLYSEIMYRLENYIPRQEGKVIYYNYDKEFGSILQEGEDNLFFRQSDFIDDEEVRKYDVVEYSVINSYDAKRKQPSSRAVMLRVLYEDIDY